MPAAAVAVESRSPAETEAIGEALGRRLAPGHLVALAGPLGAGKTCLARGLARGAGVPPEQRVRSPSYTLVHEYRGRLLLAHADLYRLGDPEELRELGLDHYLEVGAAVVEWADRFPGALPAARLDLRIEVRAERARRLHLAAADAAHARLLAALPPGGGRVSGAGTRR